MAVDITLIITNWNGRDLLRECLPSIQKAVAQDTSHTYEVMVIDDCSSDDSLKILEEEFPWVRREKTPQNCKTIKSQNCEKKTRNQNACQEKSKSTVT